MIKEIKTTKTTLQDAFNEAVSQIDHARLIFYVSTWEDIKTLTLGFYEMFPHIPCIGLYSEIISDVYKDPTRLIVLVFDDDFEIRTGCIRNLSTSVSDVMSIEHNINEIHPGNEDTICLEVCTGFEETFVTTLDSVLEPAHIGLIGGTAFGEFASHEPVVTYQGELLQDTCVYALIRNKKGRIRLYYENIYGLMNDQVHMATKVELDKKALIEIDGLPAAQVYSDAVHLPIDQLIDNVMQNPLGRRVGEKIYVASPRTLLDDGTIINYKRFNLNDTISVLELKDYQKINKETMQTIISEIPHRDFVLVTDCIYRYNLFNNKHFMKDYIDNLNTLGRHVGYISYGEQYRNQHINQSMLCAVFESEE